MLDRAESSAEHHEVPPELETSRAWIPRHGLRLQSWWLMRGVRSVLPMHLWNDGAVLFFPAGTLAGRSALWAMTRECSRRRWGAAQARSRPAVPIRTYVLQRSGVVKSHPWPTFDKTVENRAEYGLRLPTNDSLGNSGTIQS
jgi:hypothetical protein